MKPLAEKIAFGSLTAVIAVIGTATVIETGIGTERIFATVYGTVWFSLMWGVVAVASVYVLKRRLRFMRPASVTLHVAFIMILAGALLTRISSESGILHLREGEPTAVYTDENGTRRPLSFTAVLKKFSTEYYPGTEAPSDYISQIAITTPNGKTENKKISMNNIATVGGWRLYQSSFDEDGRGSWLALNRDIYGIPVTYAGYIMLFVSFIWMLAEPRGTFRRISSRLVRRTAVILLPALMFSSTEADAAPTTLSQKQASAFGKVQLLFNDRIAPIQTLAVDFTHKLTGQSSHAGYTAEQVLAGWLFYPEEWQYEPMIKIKSRALRSELGLREYAAFIDFFDSDRKYILEPYCRKMYLFGSDIPFGKAVREVDEKIQLIIMLQQGTLLSVFPYTDTTGRTVWLTPVSDIPSSASDEYRKVVKGIFPLIYSSVRGGDGQTEYFDAIEGLIRFQKANAGTTLLSDIKIAAEQIYNNYPFATYIYRINLLVGIMAFLASLLFISRNTRGNAILKKRVQTAISVFTVVSFTILTAGILLRAYISARLPFGNGYETMLLLSWIILLFALLLKNKIPWINSFALLLSGFFLLISHLNRMNPQITPLMPVLSSPLLSLHVATVMASYALLSFTFINSIAALLSAKIASDSGTLKKHALISRFLLYPALALLSVGIFTGAVWANVSWGAYWSWDPKEVWALITLLVYALPLHKGQIPFFRKEKQFHIYMIIAFTTVLMTYFGVNYILGGMHSYA